MEVIQYKCPSCGADLEFGAEKQDFACKYCDCSFSSEQLAEIYPQSEFHPLNNEEPVKTAEEIEEEKFFAEYNSLYNCPSCGAAVVTDATTSAARCFYCHSPVILSGRLSGEYKPSEIIPFKINKEQAMEKLSGYCKKRWFLPKGFKSEAVLSEITSVYTPYWIADCRTSGKITAKCTKVRVWRDSRYEYTETKEYIAVRAGDMQFEGIPADASSKADDVLMECLEPFNYKDGVRFKMSYLSGYLAERYDVAKEQVFPRISGRSVKSARDTMKSTIVGYTSVKITSDSIDVWKTDWKHMLLPVWFLSYTYKNKQYHFALNGQTGKFAGSLPVVWGKVALFAGIVTVLITGLSTLAGGFLI